jgi:hypothetical protein
MNLRKRMLTMLKTAGLTHDLTRDDAMGADPHAVVLSY